MVAAMFWLVVGHHVRIEGGNHTDQFHPVVSAASLNTPPLVERRLLATVVVNARMIS